MTINKFGASRHVGMNAWGVASIQSQPYHHCVTLNLAHVCNASRKLGSLLAIELVAVMIHPRCNGFKFQHQVIAQLRKPFILERPAIPTDMFPTIDGVYSLGTDVQFADYYCSCSSFLLG